MHEIDEISSIKDDIASINNTLKSLTLGNQAYVAELDLHPSIMCITCGDNHSHENCLYNTALLYKLNENKFIFSDL